MRCIAFVSIFILIIAFILNIVLLIAGAQPGFLDNLDIVTLNTSNVGRTLATSSNSPVESIIQDIIKSNPNASAIAAGPSASATVKDDTGEEVNLVAQAIGLQEYYAFHIMYLCKGKYYPSPAAANPTLQPSNCSVGAEFYNADNLTKMLQTQLKIGSLPDLGNEANDAWSALQTVYSGTFIIFCITIIATGFTILTGIIALCVDRRAAACCNGLFTILVTICSVIASSLVTAIAYAIDALANANTDKVGLTATKGSLFLGLTWTTTTLLLISFICWSVDCCVGGDRRNRGRYARANDKDAFELRPLRNTYDH